MHRFGTWKTDPASPPMSRINVPLTTTTLFMPMLFVCTDPPSLSIRPSHSGAASNKGSAPLGFCCNILNLLHETYFGEGVPSLQIEIQSTMGRSPCCEKVGLKKGPWTPEEDQKLLSYIEKHGHGSWRALPSKAGLQRCGKSCRLRWTNYLRPDIKRGEFSLQEEQTIIQLHALLGNRWSSIATHLPKRTDNEIKNYWNTHLKKRLAKMGIDPCTHKAKSDTLSSVDGHPRSAANLSHMAQWESARLEAEARLVRESKLRTTASTSAILPGSSSSSSSTTPGCIDVLRAWQVAWPTKPLPTQGEKIDHESPTSTLTFTENRLAFPATVESGLVDGDGTAFSNQEGDNLEALAPWLPEACTVQEACILGQFGAGFTGMLLRGKNSDCCGDSFGDDHEKCAREEGEGQGREEFMDGEENNYYWNSILNSVNSSSSSSSPSVFYN